MLEICGNGRRLFKAAGATYETARTSAELKSQLRLFISHNEDCWQTEVVIAVERQCPGDMTVPAGGVNKMHQEIMFASIAQEDSGIYGVYWSRTSSPAAACVLCTLHWCNDGFA